MLWRDTVDLITVTHTDDGPEVIVKETSRTVFANKIGVTRTEFYQAIQNNLMPTVTFVIHEFEYDGEQKLRHNGSDYLIIRTYARGDDKLELVCQAYDDVQTNLARLRNTVEIWRITYTENTMGEKTPVPERLYVLPAQIDFKGGGNSETNGIIETTNSATVVIRYREGITPDMFVKINGERYEIRYIEDPQNRHETLVLTVEKVIP